MGLVTQVTVKRDVPGEPGAWVEIRQLSWITLDKARMERLRTLGAMKDAVMMVRDLQPDAAAAARAAADDDPATKYDRRIVLRHGIVGWSYNGAAGALPDAIDELDDPTAEWAAKEIIAYSVPTRADVKDISSPSTAT